MATSLETRVGQLIDDLRPGWVPTLIWTNPLDGKTWSLEDPNSGEVQFVKVASTTAPASHHPHLEAERIDWIGNRLPIPKVLGAGLTDGLSWMITARLPGTQASDVRWNADPEGFAKVMGQAIRHFHDQLADSVGECPWSWRINERVLYGRGLAEARTMARDSAPAEVDLVVSHGDNCAPNILLHDDMSLAGYTDFGKVGVAARAADLGSHQWSLEFNGMGDQVQTFLDAYGYAGDRAEVQWYKEFWEVV